MVAEKPIKPIEPRHRDFPEPKEPNAYNHQGEPIKVNHDFIDAYHKWQKDVKQYEEDLEEWEQKKLIRLVKNAKEDYIFKKYKIVKR